MRVCGLEFGFDLIDWISKVLLETPTISRRSLASKVCERKSWTSASGRLKEAVCRKALGVLSKKGILDLPGTLPQTPCTSQKVRSVSLPCHLPEVVCFLDQLGDITIELVESSSSSLSDIWRGLMTQHPLGVGSLCGAQLRYLVHSSVYGFVGALSFSSASWALKDRDTFIGWSDAAHRENIQRVVRNSRFLILPTVNVPNLASHVLSLSAKRISSDWRQKYGVEIVLLETFVDPQQFHGTSYRAANWEKIGQTSGRRGTPKDIYLYPLSKQWKAILHKEPQIELCARRGIENPADWVEQELGTVELFDPRLERRLFSVVRDFYGQPLAPIPQSCMTVAKVKGAYRLFGNEKVSMERVLRAHKESTVDRIKNYKVVLAVQDTTSLNYTSHKAKQGLGPISKVKQSRGLHLHDTMAFNTEGTPLGLLDVQCWARDPADKDRKKSRPNLPIEQKESMKWLNSYRAVSEVQKICPDTMLVSVGDREADIYDLFWEASKNSAGPKLLVRCNRSCKRKVEQKLLWDLVANQPMAGHQGVLIPRQGCQLEREARLEIRHAKVTLTPPTSKNMPALDVWMVYALEIEAPQHVKKPLEWMLLTTVETQTFEQACERLEWYAKRWGVEVYHRTLKSGCRIEDRQLETTDSLEACLAVDMVVAWRIFHLTKLAREIPDAPCTVYFEEAEWKTLYILATNSVDFPKKEPTLREAVRMMGKAGGHLGRKSDGEPGTTSLWRALVLLHGGLIVYRAMEDKMKLGP